MRHRLIVLIFSVMCSMSFTLGEEKSVRLGDLDMSLADLERGEVNINKAPRGEDPIVIAGKPYEYGISMAAPARFLIDLHGTGVTFSTEVGACERRMPAGFAPPPGITISRPKGSLELLVMGDKKLLWKSGSITDEDEAEKVDIDIRGINKLALVILSGSGTGPGPWGVTAALGSAHIIYNGSTPPEMLSNKFSASSEPSILTPPEGKTPRINGARIVGAGPGRPFLFMVPVTGASPLSIKAEGLPETLVMDSATGIISGTAPPEGEYIVKIRAENSFGVKQQNLTIKAGSQIALTPPLGWNSWNVWGKSINQEKVMQAADAMAEKLSSHGWTYINIDDGWEAESRTNDGELLGNEKFPDFKKLADYVHAKGLKIGIYSSPGPTTCGGHLGSYEHELQDAQTWTEWGIDYLKYDWCSYSRITRDRENLAELQKPYVLMRQALDTVGRDVVYSLCQYGMGNVWEWGAAVGGNLWRTSGDIRDTWSSLLETGFALSNDSWKYAKPGNWNDPDMLVIGKVGWGPDVHDSGLTPNEQYTHISLWSLQAAPLLIGCDMSRMDDFTLGLLTNDEVLEVNQDPMGRQARQVLREADYQIWAKDMEDGSKSVGIFYTGLNKPGSGDPVHSINWDNVSMPAKMITVNWHDLEITGNYQVRDLWRQEDLGTFNNKFETEVNFHGVQLVRLIPLK